MSGSSDPDPLVRSTGCCETRTVLVVDDDPDLTALAGAYLGRLEDVAVRTASDPEEALARVDETVDCVVSDYEMPEMDGIAFLDAVRSSYPDVPFVIFTGSEEEGVAERARARGAQYIEKGPSAGGFDRLAAAVEAKLGR